MKDYTMSLIFLGKAISVSSLVFSTYKVVFKGENFSQCNSLSLKFALRQEGQKLNGDEYFLVYSIYLFLQNY